MYGINQDSDEDLSIISSTSESEESDSEMSDISQADDVTITNILEGNKKKYINSAKVGKSKKQVTKRMKERTRTEDILKDYDGKFSDQQRHVIKQVKKAVWSVVVTKNMKSHILASHLMEQTRFLYGEKERELMTLKMLPLPMSTLN